jgi:hypothetical protein
VGLVGWVLSQIWVYLLAGAAVALVGWMAWMLARSVRWAPSAARPHLVPAQTPRSAALPDQRYRALVQVDPKVFDDPVLAETAALQVFGSWVAQLPMPPSDPSDVVRSLELRIRHIGRLESELVERSLEWRDAPYGGNDPPTGPKIAPDAVDPWSVTPEDLRAASLYIASCDRCAGDGKVACPNCAGSMRTTCDDCKGAGKAYGLASNGSRRLLNCKVCKGKGDLKCTNCSKGKATCPTCHGLGRNERWLVMVDAKRSDIQVEPDGEVTKAFQWGSDGSAATLDELEADARVFAHISSAGPLSEGEISATMPAGWMQAHWRNIQPRLRHLERIGTQTLCLLEVPSIELQYSLGSSAPTAICFEGRRMLAPPASLDRQFEARSRKIRRVRFALMGVAAAVPLAYLFRGSYFWSGAVAALSASTLAATAAVDGFIRSATLGQPRARTWAVGAAVAALAACAFGFKAEPSERAARAYVAAGSFDTARAELGALGSRQAPSRAQLWADVALGEAEQTTDVSAIAERIAQISPGLPQRGQATQRLFDVTSQRIAHDLSTRNPAAASAVLAQAMPIVQDRDGAALAPKFAELRAQIREQEHAQCVTDICRWKAALEAAEAAPSPARTIRLEENRAKVTKALSPRVLPGESPLVRVQSLNALLAMATNVEEARAQDQLLETAKAARQLATEERGRIALLGADTAVVAAILDLKPEALAGPPRVGAGPVSLFCSERNGRCAGIYVVGTQPGQRALNAPALAPATRQMLSQAVGRSVNLPQPPPQTGARGQTTSRFREAGVTVLARWNEQALVELRLGDAKP